MGMGGRHVFPLGAVPEVVDQVSVLVRVNYGVMGVLRGVFFDGWNPTRFRRSMTAPST